MGLGIVIEEYNIPDGKSVSFLLICKFCFVEQLAVVYCIDSKMILKKFNKQNAFEILEDLPFFKITSILQADSQDSA